MPPHLISCDQKQCETNLNNDGIAFIDSIFSKMKKLQKDKERKKIVKLNRKGKHSQSGKIINKISKRSSKELTHDRADLSSVKNGEWVDDGLGGFFNREGYTGRKVEGYKVYKAHLFNKKGFGNSKECPFDCQCCFI